MKSQQMSAFFYKWLWENRRKRLITIFAGLYILYLILGYWGLSALITRQLPKQYAANMKGSLTLEKAVFNPLALSLRLTNLAVTDPENQPVFTLDQFYTNVDLSSIFRLALTFDAIYIDNPKISLSLSSAEDLNLLSLMPDPSPEPKPVSPEPEKSDDGKLFPVYIRHFRISGGGIQFADHQRSPVYTANMNPLDLEIHDFRTRSEDSSPYTLSIRLADNDMQISWEGGVSVSPVASEGRFTVSGLPLRKGWEYMADQLGFELFSGTLDLSGVYAFHLNSGKPVVTLKDGRIALADLSLGEKGQTGQSLITVPDFSIDGIAADTEKETLLVSKISTRGGYLNPVMNADGTLNLQQLFAMPASDPPSDEPPAEVPDPAEQETPASSWQVRVDTVSLDGYQVQFADHLAEPAADIAIKDITASITDISLAEAARMPVSFSARFFESGHLNLEGDVSILPVSAKLSLSIDPLPLSGLQPYLDRYTRIRLDSGQLQLTAHADYPEGGSGLKADAQLDVSDLSLRHSDEEDPFLSWTTLSVKDISYQMDDNRFEINEIGLTDPFAHLIRQPDGAINLASLTREPEAAEADVQPPPAPEEAEEAGKPEETDPLLIKINTINLGNGTFRYSDSAIDPAVDWRMHQLTGSVRGLSSEEWTRADVDLTGKAGEFAPISVSGTVNPLSGNLFTDIRMTLEGMELPVFSPYTERYVGRILDKGKLVVRVRYRVSEQVLEGENRLILDQFTLGKSVDSPDATKLPVKLALALLKDKDGVIDVDMPVRGNLGDPAFKYGKAVLNAVVNLIEKAAMYPFKTLGSLVGLSGDALRVVDYEPGDASLSPSEIEKLDKLAAALDKRPNLRLEITGTAHAVSDSEALKQARFSEKLNAEMTAKGETDPDAGVRSLYMTTFGTPPGADLLVETGKEVPADPDQLLLSVTAVAREKLLSQITVDRSALRPLARDRANAVKAYLVDTASLPEARIFLTDVALDAETDTPVPTRLSLTGK